MSRYQIAVTKIIEVTIPDGVITSEFLEEFSGSISYADTEREIAEHIAWNDVQGAGDFVEGVGPLKEQGIIVSEVDSYVETQAEFS